MVAEAQYGGRITDDLDRELFNTYTAKWFCRWAKLSSRAQDLQGRWVAQRDQKNWISGDSSLMIPISDLGPQETGKDRHTG